MTKEEMLKDDFVANHYGDRARNWVDTAFIDGAEWMQDKMIEKATQFIYDTIFGWTGGSVTKNWNQYRDEYVGRLKQAMQDESRRLD